MAGIKMEFYYKNKKTSIIATAVVAIVRIVIHNWWHIWKKCMILYHYSNVKWVSRHLCSSAFRLFLQSFVQGDTKRPTSLALWEGNPPMTVESDSISWHHIETGILWDMWGLEHDTYINTPHFSPEWYLLVKTKLQDFISQATLIYSIPLFIHW